MRVAARLVLVGAWLTMGRAGVIMNADWETKDSYNVGSQVTLECNKMGPTETETMDICPSALSEFTRTYGARTTAFTGDALRFGDVVSPNPLYWGGMYFSGTGRASSGRPCVTDATRCMQRVVCTLKEEFWGMKRSSGEQIVKLDAGDVNTMSTAPRTYAPLEQTCVMCTPRPCTDTELACPNGRVVDSAKMGEEMTSTTMDINGMPARFTRRECTSSCPAGTWLTCTDETGCTYVPPSKTTVDFIKTTVISRAAAAAPLSDTSDLGAAIGWALNAAAVDRVDAEIRRWVQTNKRAKSDVPVSLGLGVPFDACYPCSAAAGLQHFGRRISGDGGLQAKGFLQFWCPGGGAGPQMCPAGEVSQINGATLTSAGCGCVPGSFREQQGGCRPCPAGHRCGFGATWESGVEACPVDTFSVAGSSACTACGTETGRCAAHQALTRCIGAGFQTRDSRCVDCNECAEISGTSTDGVKPCLHVVG